MVMEKLVPLREAASFDKWFWRKAGSKARFAAAWLIIREFYKMRGVHGYKLRLQRSVQNIKQI